MKAYEKTTFPSLYRTTSWGDQKKERTQSNKTEFQNRNKFPIKHNITRLSRTSLNNLARGLAANSEVYYSCVDNKYIVLTSPQAKRTNDPVKPRLDSKPENAAKRCGFRQYKRMAGPDQTTFIGTFDTVYQMTQALKGMSSFSTAGTPIGPAKVFKGK